MPILQTKVVGLAYFTPIRIPKGFVIILNSLTQQKWTEFPFKNCKKVGFIGATIGICTGIGLAYILSSLGASEGAHPGTAAGGSHIAPIFLPNDLLRVWFLSLTISIAAGIFPAWKASRLSPLEALRAT